MQQWAELGRLPPVLLVTGPSGIGKRAVVQYLSQWILCERTGFQSAAPDQQDGLFGGGEATATRQIAPATAPCGECNACLKAIKGSWVDFTEIAAEDEDGGTLKIDQFRRLKATQGFGAFDGAYRIVFIRDADRMTPQAANSLLKILEEPPPGWLFFLTAADASLLLPTLVSRCQRLRLRPLPSETLHELLKLTNAPVDRQALCAELAQGSWARAQSLADPDIWDQRAVIQRFIEKPQAELNALVDWASQEDSRFQFLLDQLELACESELRELLGRQSGTDDRRARLAILRSERLFRARLESLAPLNRKLLLQDILIGWLPAGPAA